MEELFNEIPNMLKKALQQQLRMSRPSKTYDGRLKPVKNPGQAYLSPPIASGNLYKNINVYWETNLETGEPKLVAEMPYYWTWVDEGRRPGKMPPLRAIDRWVRQKKGISGIRDEKGRFIPRKTQVYLFAKSIGQYGYGGTNFVNKAINSVIDQIAEDLGEAAAQYAADLIKSDNIIVNL